MERSEGEDCGNGRRPERWEDQPWIREGGRERENGLNKSMLCISECVCVRERCCMHNLCVTHIHLYDCMYVAALCSSSVKPLCESFRISRPTLTHLRCPVLFCPRPSYIIHCFAFHCRSLSGNCCRKNMEPLCIHTFSL